MYIRKVRFLSETLAILESLKFSLLGDEKREGRNQKR
jgi:hypothetical protein